MIAALFVDTKGVYHGLRDVEVWGLQRDARGYGGPHPVVAHPPCQLWTNLAAVNFKRYPTESNRPGNDGGCFASALASVRKWGGVLEHPAFSKAWEEYDLVRPPPKGWGHICDSEYVCEVWQSAYGHAARKRTWLFYKGPHPQEMRWERMPGTHQCGWFDRKKPTLGKRAASATPIAFRDALIGLAKNAAGGEASARAEEPMEELMGECAGSMTAEEKATMAETRAAGRRLRGETKDGGG